MHSINSHDEFTRLKSVVVGTFSRESESLESQNPDSDIYKALSLLQDAYPDWYVDEVNEDLEGFCNVLRQYDVEVQRPRWPFSGSLYKTPNWISHGYDIYNVRDNHIIFGDKIISTPPSSRYRQNEHYAYYDIFHKSVIETGAKWLFAPRPSLPAGFSLPLNKNPTKLELVESKKHFELSNGLTEEHTYLQDSEIIFDAANIIRIGVDVLYLVSSTGNLSGYRWLKSILGSKYRVHLTDTYRSSHLDSTICPLRPGLVLLNGDRVDNNTIPDIFKTWDKIFFTDVSPMPERELQFYNDVRKPISTRIAQLGFESPISHISSPWGGLNVFSINEETVCVEQSQSALIKCLENWGMTVIPLQYRHCFTMLGCLHCSTLDLNREGELIDYCS